MAFQNRPTSEASSDSAGGFTGAPIPLQFVNRIRLKVLKALVSPSRPANLHPFYFGGRSEAEVDPHIVIRVVTGAAANFVHQDSLSDLQVTRAPIPSRLDFVPIVRNAIQ